MTTTTTLFAIEVCTRQVIAATTSLEVAIPLARRKKVEEEQDDVDEGPDSDRTSRSADRTFNKATKHLSDGEIIGIVFGCAVFVVGLVGLTLWSLHRRRKKKRELEMMGQQQLQYGAGGY